MLSFKHALTKFFVLFCVSSRKFYPHSYDLRHLSKYSFMMIDNFQHDTFVEIFPAQGIPQISILFPIYRRQEYVCNALKSVLAQQGVIAEIIVSDDASPDNSFQIALDTIRKWMSQNETKHKIVVRRGSTRLRRDHIHIMAEQAECDLVSQAHDDDESHPDRARLTVEAFATFPKMNAMGIECDHIDVANNHIGFCTQVTYPISIDLYSLGAVLAPTDQFLVGACLAWRKSPLQIFEHLDSSFAAVCHDWILAFRAALTGEVRLARAPLVKRRIHIGSWSSRMVPTNEEATISFGWGLQHLSSYHIKRADLERALLAGALSINSYNEISKAIEGEFNKSLEEVLKSYRSLSKEGLIPSWTQEQD